MKIDQKYKGEIFKNDGTPVPEDEWIVFRAKDLALVPTLLTYIGKCFELGCNEVHLQRVASLTARVVNFQKNNPEKCKIPD